MCPLKSRLICLDSRCRESIMPAQTPWRLPSRATEDRNYTAPTLAGPWAQWRLPSRATEDRNM